MAALEPSPGTDRPSNRSLLAVAAAWTLVFALLVRLQSQAGKGPRVFGAWSQFDGPEYLSIATRGYEQRQLVWFPLYPMGIRAVDAVVGNALHAAVALSALGGLASALLFWRWTHLRAVAVAAPALALAVFLLYPYGWFLYGVVYADAVFTALCLGAFVAVERDRYLAAGLLAALATATRPSGFALVAGISLLALERSGVLSPPPEGEGWAARLRLPVVVDRRAWRARLGWLQLGWLGLATWCAWLWVSWGSPLMWVSEQENYHDPGQATMVKQQYFAAFYESYDGRYLATTTAQLVLFTAFVLLSPAVARRFGWGYGAYVFLLAALPGFSSGTFMGIGRYLIPAFPVFALVGEWLAPRRVLRVAWLVAAAALVLVMVYGFARSWYLT